MLMVRCAFFKIPVLLVISSVNSIHSARVSGQAYRIYSVRIQEYRSHYIKKKQKTKTKAPQPYLLLIYSVCFLQVVTHFCVSFFKLQLSFETRKADHTIDTKLGIEITVLDINDNPPLFQKDVYVASVKEEEKQGETHTMSHISSVSICYQ